MSQEEKAKLNWELMDLIQKHAKCSMIDYANHKHVSTLFHLAESIVNDLKK